MSFSRALPVKCNGISTSKPALPTLPKVPSHLQSKRYFFSSCFSFSTSSNSRTILSNSTKSQVKMEFSPLPSEEDLDDIVK